MIVLSGANGQLGRLVVDRLLEKVPADQLGVSVREPANAQALANRGVRVRQASYENIDALRHAYDGATQVLIVSSNSSGADAVKHHRNAIETAVAAGAKRILYTSHMGSSATSKFGPMRDHAATEEVLKTCGVAFTSLRNGFYASSAIQFLGRPKETGEVVGPQDGPVSWTAHTDLADAAVIALTSNQLDGITPALTGSAAFDLAELATMVSEALKRPIERTLITDEASRAAMTAHGVPAWRIEIAAGFYAASREREFAKVDPTLQRLLGRAPISIRDVIARTFA